MIIFFFGLHKHKSFLNEKQTKKKNKTNQTAFPGKNLSKIPIIAIEDKTCLKDKLCIVFGSF